jgi:hypothetical protein
VPDLLQERHVMLNHLARRLRPAIRPIVLSAVYRGFISTGFPVARHGDTLYTAHRSLKHPLHLHHRAALVIFLASLHMAGFDSCSPTRIDGYINYTSPYIWRCNRTWQTSPGDPWRINSGSPPVFGVRVPGLCLQVQALTTSFSFNPARSSEDMAAWTAYQKMCENCAQPRIQMTQSRNLYRLIDF